MLRFRKSASRLQGAALRTLTDENGEPWFVAKDVCDILGIDTNHLRESLDSDEMNTLRITEGNTRGNPNKTIISEPGLYRLVMKSRKPEAKEFKRWVTHEVMRQSASKFLSLMKISMWIVSTLQGKEV